MQPELLQETIYVESVNGAVVYDALAAYYLLAPDACVLEEMILS